MIHKLTQDALFSAIRKVFSKVKDPRKNPKSTCTYTLPGVLGYFFGLFFLHSPSFNSYEEDTRKNSTNKVRKIVQKLFCGSIKFKSLRGNKKGKSIFPSSNQVRNIVDRIDPEELRHTIHKVWHLLQRSGMYPRLRTFVGIDLNLGLHVLIDGVETRCSKNIACSRCCRRIRNRGKNNETTEYYHQFLEAVVNVPERRAQEKQVLILDLEQIEREDGKEKNGSERKANKRLIERIAARHKNTRITITTDDIHNDTPTLRLLKSKNINWLMTCKPDSHQSAYDALRAAEKLGTCKKFISTEYAHKIRNKNGSFDSHRCKSCFLWDKVPSKNGDGAVEYNLVKEEIIDVNTGEILVTRGFSTDHEVDEKTVTGLRDAWRKQWRLENNGHNDLKNHGANLDHSFGHKKENLTTNTFIFTWLSWLIIQVLLLGKEDGFYYWRKRFGSLSKAISELSLTILHWGYIEAVSWRNFYELLPQPP